MKIRRNFMIVGLPVDTINIEFRHIGYITKNRSVVISSPDEILSIEDSLMANVIDFDEVIVTGTRTNSRKTETPVIVNVIDKDQNEERRMNINNQTSKRYAYFPLVVNSSFLNLQYCLFL